jgi:hypothetical protein
MCRVLFALIIWSTTAAYSHRFCVVWCVIAWSRYWFGTALHLSTVSYAAVVLLMMQIAPETYRANDERNKQYRVHLVGLELSLWHTQTAVSRSEPPMSLLLVLAFCQ